MIIIEWPIVAIALVIASITAFFLGITYRKKVAESLVGGAENQASQIIEDAKKEADTEKKSALVEAREEAQKIRSKQEDEYKERRNELQNMEKRLISKEEIIDKRESTLEKRSNQLEQKNSEIEKKLSELALQEEEIEKIKVKENEKLEEISNLSTEQAQQIVMERTEKELEREISIKIREMNEKIEEEAEKKAQWIVGYAIERIASDEVQETTVSSVTLPNEDMKGRIIGREGRNIRAFESQTGVDLIIDDTPGAVILSCFNPIRREIARLALEKLIADGRIHPARIEEMVEKSEKEVNAIIKEMGEKALADTGIYNVHPELVKLLGRLHYRTSYGQNVLNHSIQIAHLSGMIAAELGANIKLAKRAGLFHDIGKAIDQEVEGTHIELGMEYLKKYKESDEVIHAMSTHHGDYEPQTVEAVVVTAADSISAARPGARRETLESYIKRLENLEAVANSFESVESCYAIQAGREIRVMVKPEEIDDVMLPKLARDISKKIEAELDYPGNIKVNIIRETRVIDYAK